MEFTIDENIKTICRLFAYKKKNHAKFQKKIEKEIRKKRKETTSDNMIFASSIPRFRELKQFCEFFKWFKIRFMPRTRDYVRDVSAILINIQHSIWYKRWNNEIPSWWMPVIVIACVLSG